MAELRRILFVDDEEDLLSGLRRMLRPLRNQWEMAFCSSPTDALQLMAESEFDVVISDLRMPGMDGVEFLNLVRERSPNTIRVVLSGHADREMIVQVVEHTHQFLTKPCAADELRSVISEACHLRDLLTDSALVALVSKTTTLPSLPTLFLEVQREIRSPKGSLQSVGEIIAQDVAMTAKVLQIVNSSFFGLKRHIGTPSEAAIYLGLDTIRALALSVDVFRQFDSSRVRGFSIETLWEHCSWVGSCARTIALECGLPKVAADHSFLAGVLHDLGKLVLASNLPQRYGSVCQRAAREGRMVLEVEAQEFGTTHAQIGAYLLGLWGLPQPIVHAVACHHAPPSSEHVTLSALTAVHLANGLHAGLTSGDEREEQRRLDADYLDRLGLTTELDRLRDLCREQTADGEAA